MARRDTGGAVEKEFTSDRCTGVPEHAHAQCCVAHDWLYWQGGTWQQRAEADRLFRECLEGRHHTIGVWLLRFGVRIGGFGLAPTSWRWGYGWAWPHSKPSQPDPSPYTEESQRATYTTIRREAIEADSKARERH